MNPYEFFGCAEPPFSTTPNPRFAYATKEHQTAIEKIVYNVDNSRGLFLLYGDIGTGKTTISNYLADNLFLKLPDRYAYGYVVCTATRSPASFLRDVAGSYGLETSYFQAALRQSLVEFLAGCYKDGRIVVLVLDEAQLLSAPNLDTLHSLSNLQSADQQLIQIVLLAQPNIVHKLTQKKALLSRISMGSELSPLSFTDARDLMVHRLNVAGAPVNRLDDLDKIFDLPAQQSIYDASRGICRDLCQFSDATMVNAALRRQRPATMEAVAEALKDMKFKKGLK